MAAQAILVRFGQALVSMVGLTLLVFLLVRITGDPAQLLLPETATVDDLAQMRERLGLDQPLVVQFSTFLGEVATGDLGTSIRLRAPVSQVILERVPATLVLAGTSLLLALVIGIPLGLYSAYWRGGWVDRLARAVAVFGQSAPAFWVGLILIVIFAVQLRALPSGGYGGPDHIILPALTIALGAIAGLTRLVRSAMIEVLDTDYVKFLRIKGVSETSIIWKHGLRNAGLSALTFTGVLIAGLLTGSVVVETVFAWPGMGQLLSQAITGRDFPVTQGIVLVFSAVYIVVNVGVDMLYTVLNPRLR